MSKLIDITKTAASVATNKFGNVIRIVDYELQASLAVKSHMVKKTVQVTETVSSSSMEKTWCIETSHTVQPRFWSRMDFASIDEAVAKMQEYANSRKCVVDRVREVSEEYVQLCEKYRKAREVKV